MEPTTYQSLIRTYADNVRKGLADTDLNPRERKLCALILNTASNSGLAAVAYNGMTESWRAKVVTHLHELLWAANTSFFIEAVSPSARAAYSVAIERATVILRGI